MKKTYITPELEIVILDNEISLVLASNPPAGPGEAIDPAFFEEETKSPWE